MSLSRDKKTEVQEARTSTWRVRSVSPRQIAAYGRWLPLAVGQRFEAQCARGNKTFARTRAGVVDDKMTARRRVGRVARLLAS